MSDIGERVHEAREMQRKFRKAILDFLQAETDMEDTVVIGFGLVVEVLDQDGYRAALKCTSDASGSELPGYTVGGFSKVLRDEEEFDSYLLEDAFSDD